MQVKFDKGSCVKMNEWPIEEWIVYKMKVLIKR